MENNILIVEDELKLAELLRDYLAQANMVVNIISDGADVLPYLNEAEQNDTIPDIILLDIMLPNKDGLTLCREIRDSSSYGNIPIIMTTARVDEIDRLLGLDIGADDYVCKPYSPREVVARVKAMLRRQQSNRQEDQASSIGLVLEHDKMKAIFRGSDLGLTAVEYSLLQIMAKTPGKIFSRSQLMDNIYQDYRVVSERTIDSHIKKLRQKITTIDPNVELVQSVYGVGYKVEIPISI